MEKISRSSDLKVVAGPSWPGISYYCSTRQGGVSADPWTSLNVGLHTGDDPTHVFENRQKITRMSGPSRPVVWLQQVHGIDVFDADNGVQDIADTGGLPQLQSGNGPLADGAVTSRSDCVLAIMTADCLPVVLTSVDGRVIGVAHAGWRGLAAGVLENVLAALRIKYDGCGTPQWRAWIGPGISQPCFEVGDDVRHIFVSQDAADSVFFASAGRRGKWLADLAGLARRRLWKNGVSRVDVSPLCTYRRDDLFYSYRRDGVTGRMVTVAWRTPSMADT